METYSDFQYVETAFNGLYQRNQAKSVSEAFEDFKQRSDKAECYVSAFRFNEEIIDYLKDKKSVTDFDGPCWAPYFWVDIDVSEEQEQSLEKRIDKAQKAIRKFVTRLQETYHIDPNILRIYFTGSKGFCVGLPSNVFGIPPSRIFNRVAKSIVMRLVNGEIEIDPGVYDKTRLWRIPGSLNKKSNLFKIPLAWEELLSLSAQDIIVMAENPRELEKQNTELITNESLQQIYIKAQRELEEEAAKPKLLVDPGDLSEPPHRTKLCYWGILQTGVPKGKRNHLMLRLSVHLQKTLKYPHDIARAVLTEWDRKNHPPLASEQGFEKKLERYLDDGKKYDYGCRDEILQEICDKRCYLYGRKDQSLSLMTAQQLEEMDLPEATPIIEAGILPAETGMIIAGPAEAGKTLLIVEMGIRLAKGMDFLRFKVPRPFSILLVQKENALNQVKYRIRRIREALGLSHAPENFHLTSVKERFNLMKSPDQERLKDHITAISAEVVLLDPLSSFHTGDENDNMHMRAILDNLTDISRLCKCAFIVIHHYGKQGEYRGATSIKDWADTFIGYEEQYHIQRILRKVIFMKVRNGPKPRPILLERHPYDFSHTIIEEESLCPPEKVKEILDEIGGITESKKALAQEIMDEMKCSYSTARRSIDRAIEEKYVQEVEDEQDKRKRKIVSK